MIDVSNDAYLAHIAICEAVAAVQAEMTRPSVLYRPTLTLDGNAWCALLGENLQAGVAGFGDTPAEALAAFDAAFVSPIKPRSVPATHADGGGRGR